MKPFTQKIYYLLLIFISLTACRVEVTLPPELATMTTVPETTTEPAAVTVTTPETATPTQTPSPSPSPTATQTLIPTASPTLTPSPTPQPIVRVGPQGEQNINVRIGPGTNYGVVGALGPGQAAVVTGRNEDQSWWQINLTGDDTTAVGWIFAGLVEFEGNGDEIEIALAPPPPAVTETENAGTSATETNDETPASTPEDLAQQLDCGQDFCVTYQAMLPIWENGGCVGNHSIYITVLEGPPPGKPLDGVVIGDTFNNVEVGSGSHGPGRTEITLWSNSMTLVAKRHIDGTPFTSEESFNFTSHDELIPAEVLAANGYCEGRVDICEQARNNNQVCRGHYSWRVTFHKFN